MTLFTKLFEAVHSWRRRRGGPKPRKRADPTMEQLDHRQLLAVNFTGVVANDFPNTGNNGVKVVFVPAGDAPGQNNIPRFPPENNGQLQQIIGVSGKEIDQYRILYDPSDDTLNVGLEGPFNGRDGREVIAGDTDNNGNSATVDPRISNAQLTGIEQGFMDPPDMGGSKQYGIFLDLKNPLIPDVVAGFPIGDASTNAAKPYEVALARNDSPPGPGGIPASPAFDQSNVFPQYTGNYYLANDPNHPNFELQVAHFSQLYQQITGQALTPGTTLSIGAFGQSSQDPGISDEFFPPQAVTIGTITPPTPPPPPPPPPPVPCPPVSPPIFVNPHQNYHVNSAHPTPVRVSVLGSSGFDPTTIDPATVRFGDPATIDSTGATPILNFENNVNRDQFSDETFVFNGLDVNLPPGVTQAQISGSTTSGTTFSSAVTIFNRDVSYYTQSQINKQQTAWARYDRAHGIDTSAGLVPPPVAIPKSAHVRATSAAIDDLYNPFKGQRVPRQASPGGASPASTASYDPVSAPTKTVKIHTKAAAKGHKVKGAPHMTASAASHSAPTVSIAGVSNMMNGAGAR